MNEEFLLVKNFRDGVPDAEASLINYIAWCKLCDEAEVELIKIFRNHVLYARLILEIYIGKWNLCDEAQVELVNAAREHNLAKKLLQIYMKKWSLTCGARVRVAEGFLTGNFGADDFWKMTEGIRDTFASYIPSRRRKW